MERVAAGDGAERDEGVAVRPLAIDLFCGLGGWTEGLLAEGFDVIGFDIERHAYGEHCYPAQLVLQDVRTIDGAQFKNAALIVASSPCQEFSYRAMPWKRAKALGPPILGMELFAQAERIQREAIAAAGHFIPMVQENVRGAQKYVGRARWHYGSFYLWGDVPALMPITMRQTDMKVGELNWRKYGRPDYKGDQLQDKAIKNAGGSWFNVAHNTTSGTGQNPVHDGVKVVSEEGRRTDIGKGARFTTRDCGDEGTKQRGSGREWFAGEGKISRTTSSRSNARKAASARIAKIPEALARHIARVYYPHA
jgi:hypothetical protein